MNKYNQYTILDLSWNISEKSEGIPISLAYYKNKKYYSYKFEYDFITQWTQMQVLPHIAEYELVKLERILDIIKDDDILVLDNYIKNWLWLYNIKSYTIDSILNDTQKIKAWWIKKEELENTNGYNNIDNVNIIKKMLTVL